MLPVLFHLNHCMLTLNSTFVLSNETFQSWICHHYNLSSKPFSIFLKKRLSIHFFTKMYTNNDWWLHILRIRLYFSTYILLFTFISKIIQYWLVQNSYLIYCLSVTSNMINREERKIENVKYYSKPGRIL